MARTIAITGGTALLPHGEVENCTLLIKDGKIRSVGRHAKPPRGCTKVDASGLYVAPGLIDPHTHIGLHEYGGGPDAVDVNEKGDPIVPNIRALDGFNPADPAILHALRGGVTSVMISPGSGNVFGGQMAALKLGYTTADEGVYPGVTAIKAAFGQNPKKNDRKYPSTRMGVAGIMRDTLAKTLDYIEHKKSERKKRGHVEKDFRLEPLIGLLGRDYPLRAHAHYAHDIMTAFRIAEEFNIRLVVDHATEGHKIAGEFASRKVPAVVGPTMGTSTKPETRDKSFETPGILAEAGVTVAITTDHPVTHLEYLRVCGAMAEREGMPRLEAFKAISLNPARIIGIDDRVGSLEEGKDADVVLWNGHPFELASTVERVYLQGVEVDLGET
jgi:imidazolonepropionase-like amidohydrolase